MTKDDVDGTTGFGISTFPVGPNYATIRVDPYRQRVDFVPETAPTKIPATDPPQSWTFSEYVHLSDDDLHAAYMEA